MDENPQTPQTPRDRIFGVVLGTGALLYQTLKSNPFKTLRAFKKLKIPTAGNLLVEFSMKRKRGPGDVRGLSIESMRKKDAYIGPMR